MASDLDQLIEMGFDQERAQLAVAKAGNLQGALEWLEENQDKPLDEIKAAQEAEGEDGPALKPGEEARSLVCNDCGKKFRSQAQAEFHASKSQHVDFSESMEEIAPLTEDQKKEKLQELRERLAAKRAVQSVQDKADDKRNEQIRMKATKESQDAKEALEKKERLKEAAQKKKDKQDEIDAKKRVQAQIQADKEERRRKAELAKAEREGKALPQESAPVPAPASKPASEHNETRLRFQTPQGNIMKRLPVTTTLFEVAAALKQEDGVEVQSFTQTFPRKTWNSEFFGETLKELGLVPSASLIVQ
ncbi:hypothetical protein N7533_002553 [Penicillium manginii]|uniref:uncharacterized protein n=1 Tax=Penicillium manginii TaxID=203109 RepID=UPI00254939A7|nr:uncharacterized protein N7533_002553 [Penicillium manginii]KAJ5763872.1 hypothetical protein N7533_002553 [Penicillium manginii]